MSERLSGIDPADMTSQQRDLYRRFAEGERVRPGADFTLVDDDGRLLGPPAIWLLEPRLGTALEQLGAAIRFRSSLPARAREIAILMVAHQRRSPFELHAHTRAGHAAGLTEDDLAALAAGRPPSLVDDVERVVYATTRVLLDRQALDDAAFRTAIAGLGREGLFELVVLMGWYEMLATQLSVFDVRGPIAGGEGTTP